MFKKYLGIKMNQFFSDFAHDFRRTVDSAYFFGKKSGFYKLLNVYEVYMTE